MKSVFLALVLLFFSLNSHGETGSWTKVKRIFTPANGGGVFVYFGNDSMPGCYTNNGAYINNDNSEGAEKVYSSILAALMANRDVQPYYEITGADQSSWGRCKISAVYVQ